MSKAQRTNSTWAFDFTNAKLDRRTRRTAIDQPMVLSDLVGVDGNYEGGLRPHNGFLREQKLDASVNNVGLIGPGQTTTSDSNHDEGSKILDFFPFSIAVGTDNYAYGHVYRVRRTGSTTLSDIKVRLWDSKNTRWTTRVLVTDVEDDGGVGGSAGTPSEINTTIDSPMDVTTFGRFCYVFVRGRPVVLLQFDSAETGLDVVGDDPASVLLGPNLQPKCEGPSDLPEEFDGFFGYVTEPTEDYATGFGRVFLTNTDPSAIEDSAGRDLGLSDQMDPAPHSLTEGNYAFAYFLMDSTAGRRTSLSTIGEVTEGTFPSAPRQAALELAYNATLYDQAWVYRSVRTEDAGGAYAAKILHLDRIIDLADYQTSLNAAGGTDIDTSGDTTVEQDVIAASGDIEFTGTNEITLNSGTWDFDPLDDTWIRVTGCTDNPENNGIYQVNGDASSTVITVDGTPFTVATETGPVDIDVITVAENQYDTGGDWRHAIYYYVRSDKELSFQESYEDYAFFETTLPKGGTATVYNGALLVSDIIGENISADEEEQPDTDTRNISELRWSSLTGASPELFAPSDRYTTKNPASRIIAFAHAGPNVIGFARDRQYHIRTEGTIIKVQEMHIGYGIAGRYCHASIGNRVYFLSERGLKSVASNGQLDDVRSINMDIIQRWRGDLDECSMAHDTVTGCLHILNPVKKEMLNIWFNSGCVTRDVDIPFDLVKQGPWPGTYSGVSAISSSNLVERAIFLKNFADETYGSIPSSHRPYLYTMDHKRLKLDDSSDARHALLHLTGNLVGTVESAGSNTVTCDQEIAQTADQLHIDGAYLYCVSSSDPTYVGLKSMILGVNAGDAASVVLEDGTFDSLPADSKVVVSPVPFAVHTCRMIAISEGGQPFSKAMAHRAQVESADVMFTRVSGEGDGTDEAVVFGSVFQGDNDTKLNEGVSSATIREGALETAIPFTTTVDRKGGVAGVNLTARFRVLCPDLDFVCLGAVIYGTMTSERRNY